MARNPFMLSASVRRVRDGACPTFVVHHHRVDVTIVKQAIIDVRLAWQTSGAGGA